MTIVFIVIGVMILVIIFGLIFEDLGIDVVDLVDLRLYLSERHKQDVAKLQDEKKRARFINRKIVSPLNGLGKTWHDVDKELPRYAGQYSVIYKDADGFHYLQYAKYNLRDFYLFSDYFVSGKKY